MLAFSTDHFVLPLPPDHRFPMEKHARLRERCLKEGVVRPEELREPAAATLEELALVHEPAHLARVETGTVTPPEQRRIGILAVRGANAGRLRAGHLPHAGIPVAVAMAGGYARDTRDTVDIHRGMLRTAALVSLCGPAADAAAREAACVPHS